MINCANSVSHSDSTMLQYDFFYMQLIMHIVFSSSSLFGLEKMLRFDLLKPLLVIYLFDLALQLEMFKIVSLNSDTIVNHDRYIHAYRVYRRIRFVYTISFYCCRSHVMITAQSYIFETFTFIGEWFTSFKKERHFKWFQRYCPR